MLDVRGRAEYDAGHLRDVPNIPIGYVTDRIDEVPQGRPLLVHCKGGGRSAIAASLLAARGFEVANVAGGYAAWQAAGLPTEQEQPISAAR